MKIRNKKFIYLISPNKIKNRSFYISLNLVLKSNKVKFFQLRLKKENIKKKIIIAKKILKICKKNRVKLIINDNPSLVLKVNAHGCHLGQKDMNIVKAKKILKNKIVGITCHNSISLARKAYLNGASYIALGAFYKTKTKKVTHNANIKTLNKIKKSVNLPVVAIGGINEKNYKKLLLNKADFLAISGYVWRNKKLKPHEAIKNLS
ncbi:thiamine phosphate synthase [Candidatus Pelagibacter sp.]|nr:thiamine phosphate synthase [Candidatus Pelagibacter sp.]